ncbi:MAG: hypothetical protein ACREIA_17835 [Opitutaceae bacterium]
MTRYLPPALALLVLAAGFASAAESNSTPAGRTGFPYDTSANAGISTQPEEAGALRRLWTWSDARLRGIFEAILPETQERRTLRLSVSPHFSDFLREDHVRLPLGVVYGLNRSTEAEIEVEPYFANPFKDGQTSGFANLRFAFKHRWTPPTDRMVDAATGFSIVRPVPGSPYDLTQGVNRYSLYATFARPSRTIENLEGFFNISYDFLVPSSAVGEIREDDPHDDFGQILGGVLYRKKAVTYGLSLGWAHTFDGEETNFITVTPSIIYNLPRRYTFNMRGQWQVGAAVEAKRYGDKTDIDVRVRVRWLIDFKKVWREWREVRPGRAEG